jgi:hypothetical protein
MHDVQVVVSSMRADGDACLHSVAGVNMIITQTPTWRPNDVVFAVVWCS